MASRCGILNQSYTNLEQTGRPGGAVLKLLDSIAVENGFYTHGELKSEMEIKLIKEAAIERIKDVGTDGLETKEVLDKMLAEVTDREDTMRWAQDEFRNVKDKMIAMISKIELPRSY